MDKRRVLILAPLPANLIGAMLQACGDTLDISEFQFATYEGTEKEELLEAVKTAEIIFGDHTYERNLDADAIEAMENCKFIQQLSSNYSYIDIDAAAKKNIPVAIVCVNNATAVAEHVMATTLACLKKLMLQYARTMGGQWDTEDIANYGVFELSEKLFGFLGFDEVAREVAVRAKAFGCELAYNDEPRLSADEERELGLTFMELQELAQEADVLSIHLPADNTTKVIDGKFLSLMKPTTIITNVASPGSIDELALSSALLKGVISGAAIDVLETEPPKEDNPLLKSPNVVVTPHSAGSTSEGQMRDMMAGVANVARYIEGAAVENIVNGIKV